MEVNYYYELLILGNVNMPLVDALNYESLDLLANKSFLPHKISHIYNIYFYINATSGS